MKVREWIHKHLYLRVSGETWLAVVTLLLMWAGYYVDNRRVFGDSEIWAVGVWGIGGIVILTVLFPVWWIVRYKEEGFAGLGVRKEKLGLALLIGLGLAGWRLIELLPYLGEPGIWRVMAFNLLSIWEVVFLFGWLFTRFAKAFGKIGACVGTAIAVGIYHFGSLPVENILYLMFCVFVCAVCVAFTGNIFTVWPMYWVIGCTASMVRGYGPNVIAWDMVMMMGIALALQLIGIGGIALRMRWIRKTHGRGERK
jgi:hypothetical protein